MEKILDSISKHVERFKLRRVESGYLVTPLEPAVPGPLLLALFEDDSDALHRPLVPAKDVVAWVVGELMVRARRLGLLLEPKGRLQDPTLHLSRVEHLAATPEVRQPFAALPGVYAAHWGLTDLYPEHQAALEDALSSGQAFDTGEFGAKKEIEFARVRRETPGGPVEVHVRCEADDGVALADTAFWRAAGGNAHCDSGEDALLKAGVSPDEVEAELQTLAEAADVGDTNEARQSRLLTESVSMEQMMTVFSELVDLCEAELESRSARMEQLARARLEQLSVGR